MKKFVLALLMVCCGTIGLLATACGLIFFNASNAADGLLFVLLGVLPGAAFLFAAWALFKSLRAPGKTPPPPAPPSGP